MTPSSPKICLRAVSALLLILLLASACASTSDSAVATEAIDDSPVEGSAPNAGTFAAAASTSPGGWLYVGSLDGELATIDLDSGSSGVLWPNGAETDLVLEIGPGANADSLQVVLGDPSVTPMTSELHEVAGPSIRNVGLETDAQILCLDPHPNAVDIRGARFTNETDAAGAVFAPVVIAGNQVSSDPAFETVVSQVCPRWTADRAVVATSIVEGPVSNTVIDGALGRHELSFTNCSSTPTSISPNDATLLIAVTCFGSQWQESGLYAVELDALDAVNSLVDLRRIDDGLISRSSWHPDGEWVAVVRADPVESQTFSTRFTELETALRIVDVTTSEHIEIDKVDGQSPFSVLWLSESAHES